MGQEILDLGTAALPAKTVSEAITTSLKSFLDSAADAKEAARSIRHHPELAAEAVRAYPAVAQITSAAGREGVYIALQRLIVLYGRPDYGPGEEGKALSKTWLQIYGEALDKYPVEALIEAVTKWISHGKPFFPKPAELVKLAEPKAFALWKLSYRLKVVAEQVTKDTPPKLTEEEKINVQAGLRDLAATLLANSRIERPGHGMSREEMANRIRAKVA